MWVYIGKVLSVSTHLYLNAHKSKFQTESSHNGYAWLAFVTCKISSQLLRTQVKDHRRERTHCVVELSQLNTPLLSQWQQLQLPTLLDSVVDSIVSLQSSRWFDNAKNADKLHEASGSFFKNHMSYVTISNLLTQPSCMSDAWVLRKPRVRVFSHRLESYHRSKQSNTTAILLSGELQILLFASFFG